MNEADVHDASRRPDPEGTTAPGARKGARSQGAHDAGRAAGGGVESTLGLPSARDLAEVPAVEVIATLAVHLMTAAAVQLGLGEPEVSGLTPHQDLDEARKLIVALAGLVTAAAPEIGSQHAAPLRDGLRTLQLAFREASVIPDEPGSAPGEKITGPVLP